MKLDRLKNLYIGMKNSKIERYKIQFTFNNVSFDVFFFIDENPYLLVFGVKAVNFYFEVKVKPGFSIDTFLPKDIHTRLMAMLNLKYDPNSSFKLNYFFEEFNKKIPQKVVLSNQPKSNEVGCFRKNVEENDKVYFLGWRDNQTRNENVSFKNLMKTKALLGNTAYERSRQKNFSSRWTEDIKLAQEFYLPD
ncbi:DUF6037 family protein [Paenibacillus amylolyticus]|uniref:DUF6037 family protein n=1 Tax=Paenibacillus amylolyticus TaxID=1451 RepID=UPI0034507168